MAEEYNKLVKNITDSTFIGQTLSLAKDVGILDALINAEKPLTSTEIAESKQLKERYIREALGCLSGARLILLSTNEDGSNVYSMNEDQKRGLEMGFTAFHIDLIGAVCKAFTPVRECVFKSGPYGYHYEEKAMDAMQEMAVKKSKTRLGKTIGTVPGLKQKLEEGIEVIEFGTGMGVDIIQLAKMYPKSRFTASDIRECNFSRSKSVWENIHNLSFRILDVCNLDGHLDQIYDWAFSFDVIHDIPYPEMALKGIKHVLKPGGAFTFIDHTPTEDGTHQEALGNLHLSSLYGQGTFMCIHEGLRSEDSKVLGPCAGKKVLRNMALQAGFESCSCENMNDYQIIFTCM